MPGRQPLAGPAPSAADGTAGKAPAPARHGSVAHTPAARSPGLAPPLSRASSARCPSSRAPVRSRTGPAPAPAPAADTQRSPTTVATACSPDDACPVSRQIQRLLLEHVFHLAPRAIQLFVEPLRRAARWVGVVGEAFARQVFVTRNRGLSPNAPTSALAITRRARRQLPLTVWYANAVNPRVAAPVRQCRARASAIALWVFSSNTLFLPSPRQ